MGTKTFAAKTTVPLQVSYLRKILLICATIVAIATPTQVTIDQISYSHPINTIDLSTYTDIWLEHSPGMPNEDAIVKALKRRGHKDHNLVVISTSQPKGFAKLKLRRILVPACVVGPYTCFDRIKVFTTTTHEQFDFGKCKHTIANITTVPRGTPVAHLLLASWLGRIANDSTNAPQCAEAQGIPDHARYSVKAYPTDAAERKRDAKRAAKLAGKEWVVQTQKKFVEDHYDDCGEDVSAIADDEYKRSYLGCDSEDSSGTEADTAEAPHLTNNNIGIEQFALFGSQCTGIPNVSHNVELLPDTQRLFAHLHQQKHSQHECEQMFLELCSCKDGSGRVAARLGNDAHRTDVLTAAHFREAQTQHSIKDFVTTHAPAFITLTTAGHDNFFHNVAKHQLSKGKHFAAFISGRVGPEWQELMHYPRLYTTSSTNSPITLITSSLNISDDTYRTLQQSETAQGQWSWSFATSIVEGFCRHQQAYPTIATGTDDSEAVPAEESFKCPGCRWRTRRDDPAHTRVEGECKYPHDIASEWTCAGCKKRSARFSHEHTYQPNECRWATAPTRGSQPRKGAHPRPGRQRATAEPTAGLPGLQWRRIRRRRRGM